MEIIHLQKKRGREGRKEGKTKEGLVMERGERGERGDKGEKRGRKGEKRWLSKISSKEFNDTPGDSLSRGNLFFFFFFFLLFYFCLKKSVLMK